MSNIIADCLADIGMEIGKEYIKKGYDEKKLHDSLIDYIESQRKYNEICLHEEEFDFQGLFEYIHNNFFDDVKKRIMSVDSKKDKKHDRQLWIKLFLIREQIRQNRG